MTKYDKLIAANSLAAKFYPKKKLQHAIRVAEYAYKEALCNPAVDEVDVYIVGILHDIIEDTDCGYDELEDAGYTEDIQWAIELLTHDKESYDYKSYIERIAAEKNLLAIYVKRADMKDHLMQEETLTDKLKEKYFPVVGLLL